MRGDVEVAFGGFMADGDSFEYVFVENGSGRVEAEVVVEIVGLLHGLEDVRFVAKPVIAVIV